MVGCPGNLTNYTAPGVSWAAVTWDSPIATDNCDGSVTVVCMPSSGTLFSLGATRVSCQANDSSGNTNSYSFMVSVLPAEIPLITDFQVAGTNIVIQFKSMNVGQYSVQASSSSTDNWTNVVTGIPGTGEIITQTIAGGTTFLPRFFRVKLSLP